MHAQRSCEGYIGFNVFEWSVSQSVRQSCIEYTISMCRLPITLFYGEFSKI